MLPLTRFCTKQARLRAFSAQDKPMLRRLWNVKNGIVCRDHGTLVRSHCLPDQCYTMERIEEDLADATCARRYTKEKENAKEVLDAQGAGDTDEGTWYGLLATGCHHKTTNECENYYLEARLQRKTKTYEHAT